MHLGQQSDNNYVSIQVDWRRMLTNSVSVVLVPGLERIRFRVQWLVESVPFTEDSAPGVNGLGSLYHLIRDGVGWV